MHHDTYACVCGHYHFAQIILGSIYKNIEYFLLVTKILNERKKNNWNPLISKIWKWQIKEFESGKSRKSSLSFRFSWIQVWGVTSSICSLKHLRFMSLAYNCRLKAFPDSIRKLLNQQMLNLLGCEQLPGLPRDIGKLVILDRLDLTSQLTRLLQNVWKGWLIFEHCICFDSVA